MEYLLETLFKGIPAYGFFVISTKGEILGNRYNKAL